MRERVIVDGDPACMPGRDQVMLDAQDGAIRLVRLAEALCQEEDARRVLRDHKAQCRRAEHTLRQAHERVIMLASIERRRAKGGA